MECHMFPWHQIAKYGRNTCIPLLLVYLAMILCDQAIQVGGINRLINHQRGRRHSVGVSRVSQVHIETLVGPLP